MKTALPYIIIAFVYTISMVLLSIYSTYHGCG